MATTILILTAVFLFGIGLGAVIWFIGRSTKAVKGPKTAGPTTVPVTFHWGFIILPLAIFLLSVILTIYFYRLLPAEVAYRFKLDGSPDGWLSREMTVSIMLGAQFLLALAAGATTWGITKMGFLSGHQTSLWVKPERVLAFMGNMLAIPQLILCFATLDIFSYNAYQVHIMPLWLFALIVMVIGALILGIFSIPVMLKAWKALSGQPGNNLKE